MEKLIKRNPIKIYDQTDVREREGEERRGKEREEREGET